MAEVIGGDAPKIAQKFNEYFDGNLKKVLSKTDKIAAPDRPKVLHIADGKNLFKVDGANTIIDEGIRVAGGQNAFKKQEICLKSTPKRYLTQIPTSSS